MASDKVSETSSVCLICYKSFIKNSINAKKRIGRNLKLLFRQLNLNFGIGLDSIETCVECSSLLESYGEIYHEWKLLELQLQWRISEISNVIRTAGRIPKRVEAFRTWCKNQDNSDQLKLGSDLRGLRSRLKLECMNQRNSFPRLRLNRIDEDMAGNTRRQEHKAVFLGWVTSLIAVATLTDFTNGTTANKQQPKKIPVDETREMGPSMKVLVGILKKPEDSGPASKTLRQDNLAPQTDMGPTPALHQLPNLVTTYTTTSLNNNSDNLATGKAPTSSSSEPRVGCHCDKCGCWFDDKSSLDRHEKRNASGYAECEALIKLNASLNFISHLKQEIQK